MFAAGGTFMRRLLLTVSAVALLGALISGVARSQASSTDLVPCGPARSATISQSSSARVYRRAGNVWLCAKGSKKSRDLGVDEEMCAGGSGGCFAIELAATAGSIAAYVEDRFAAADESNYEVNVRDARTGKVWSYTNTAAWPASDTR